MALRALFVQAAAAAFSTGKVGSVRDGNGRCALHFAAQVGQDDACRYLVQEAGVSVDVQDDSGALLHSGQPLPTAPSWSIHRPYQRSLSTVPINGLPS